MSVSKLKTIYVVVIGALACVLIAVLMYALVIKKTQGRIAALQVNIQQEQQVANLRTDTEALLEQAETDYGITLAKYNGYLAQKMPPISLEDRAQGMIALWKEQAEVLGPMLEKWPGRTGVRLASSVAIPAAPSNPNEIDTSMITIPVGTFSVTGSFRSIMSHIRSWNRFGRLVKIDPVSVTGPSPGMSAQYAVTVYIFPRGEAGPTVSMAGSGTSGGGGGIPGIGGGMAGGMGGGMPAGGGGVPGIGAGMPGRR